MRVTADSPGIGAEGPLPFQSFCPTLPFKPPGTEGRPGLGKKPTTERTVCSLRPLTLRWLRPREVNRLAQVAQHCGGIYSGSLILIWVSPRHSLALKSREGRGKPRPADLPGSWSLGGGVAPKAFASFSQGGWMEALGIFQKEPN